MWIYRTQRIRSLGEDKAILIIKHPGRSRIFLCVETYQILFRKKTMGRLTLSLERVQVLGTSTLTEVLSSSNLLVQLISGIVWTGFNPSHTSSS